MARIVYDGTHVQVLFDDRGGDLLLITFNEMNMFADGVRYWGDAMTAKLSLSCIGFMTKTKNWFPQEDMKRACEAVQALMAPFSTRVCYGFSQGAYAALKYSGNLGATHVMAFSPQWTINPALLNDARFNPMYSDLLHSGMEIAPPDLGGTIMVFSDPFDRRDWLHCHRIVAQKEGIRLVPIRHIGHGSIKAVASTKMFERLMHLVVGPFGDSSSNRLHSLMKEGKKKTFHYKVMLGIAAAKAGHLRWARDLYDQSSLVKADHEVLQMLRRLIDQKVPQPSSAEF